MSSQVQVKDRRQHSAGKVGREKVLAGLPVADPAIEQPEGFLEVVRPVLASN